MAKISKICDINQAFNFKNDVQSNIGFIREMSISSVELNADLNLYDPVTRDFTQVCAAINSVIWDGGKTQPIFFDFQVSLQNKQLISQLVHSSLDNIGVALSFAVFEYDLVKKNYFESLYVEENLESLIYKEDSNLSIIVADEINKDVLSPVNYQVTVGLIPEGKAQIIDMAFSETSKIAKTWGIDVA